jgi:hypothetical protein
MVTSREVLRGVSAIGGHLTGHKPKPEETREEIEARKARAKAAYAIFTAKHTGCACHVLYGNQPRPVGYLERERDRSRLRRELRAQFRREQG